MRREGDQGCGGRRRGKEIARELERSRESNKTLHVIRQDDERAQRVIIHCPSAQRAIIKGRDLSRE